MKRSAAFLSLSLAALALVATPALARHDIPAPAASPAFEKIKALAGDWKGKSPEGEVTVSYRVVSSGSAVIEEMSHGNMVTVYHQDGDRLMMTHYCMAQNQPRMRTEPVKGDPKSLKFSMVDVTNLAKPTDMHMTGLTISFLDANHISQEWTFSENGKDTPATFTYERAK